MCLDSQQPATRATFAQPLEPLYHWLYDTIGQYAILYSLIYKSQFLLALYSKISHRPSQFPKTAFY